METLLRLLPNQGEQQRAVVDHWVNIQVKIRGTGHSHMGAQENDDPWRFMLPSLHCWTPQSFLLQFSSQKRSLFVYLYLSCLHFPPQIVKTNDISPSQNYILACHPHGLMAHSCFGHFATDRSGFSKTFPGITPYMLTLGAFFWVPFFRDYVMSTGEWLLGG